MPEPTAPNRIATVARRYWWAYVVIGVGFLAVATYRVVERSNGWAVSAGIWVVIGMSQIGLGVLNRRGSRRDG